MKQFCRRTLAWLSDHLALTHLRLQPERPALVVFAFHVLFPDQQALGRHLVDPQQQTTVAMLAQLLAYFQAHGYAFVTPEQVARGLDPAGRYAWLTFDDGYYNNHLALPVLKHYGVPATFFISSHHVLTGQAFWWDVVYRHRRQQPLAPAAQQAEYALLKQLPYPEIDEYLRQHFGPEALRPVSDLDRPFTAAELQAFAQEPEVILGNHTVHHAILTNYPPTTALQELTACQRDLSRLGGGSVPQAVAYPNGNHSPAVQAAATAAGLTLGATVEPGKNYLPLRNALEIKRFMLWGTQPIEQQCALYRADFHLRERLRAWRRGAGVASV